MFRLRGIVADNSSRGTRRQWVCVLTFDRPGSSANIFDRATLAELRQELDFMEEASQLKGVIFISAKPAIFIAGLDLKTIGENASAGEVHEIIQQGQNLFSRIAALEIPTVAAIHGAALGGGCEISLACDYRIASPDRATKIGLPETKLGLLPAWGGSTRLPRLIGLPKALDFILAGKIVAPRQALKLGMIDEIVPSGTSHRHGGKKSWSGKAHRPNHWLVNNPLVMAVIARRLRPQLLKKTRGHYPATMKALEVMTHGIGKSIPDSLALEREGILELCQNEVCRNLLRIFFLQERAKKVITGQIGNETGGTYGRHRRGCDGRGHRAMAERKKFAGHLARHQPGTSRARHGQHRQIYQRRRQTPCFYTARGPRPAWTTSFPRRRKFRCRHVDIVIEAAVENLELKKKLFSRLDELAGEETILATNTSALPISELAASTQRPERVVGLHFFNPVHRMQLVEIIAARQTAPEILQRAVKFAQQIGKLPVVVKDSPGFLVNRILMPYLVEAGNLFENGASIEASTT